MFQSLIHFKYAEQQQNCGFNVIQYAVSWLCISWHNISLLVFLQVLREALESNRDKLEQRVEEIIKVKNIKPQKDPL